MRLSLNIISVLLISILSPGHASPLNPRQTISPLSPTQIEAFKPFTFFANAAYCSPSATRTWTCGASCDAIPDFIPVDSGGDGDNVQFWFVGYAPTQGMVIVGHQGTDPSHLEADLTDIDFFLTNLDSTLFPGVDSSVMVHSGFADEHAQTALSVLAAVQAAISAHGATKVTTVGHSLGAAIALLDGIYLPLHISGVTFTTIGYGLPRVGNQAFADYVDAHLALTHINNKEDPIPILPGEFLGFVHPSGEIHIQDSNAWLTCPGQDNPSDECIVGDVPTIFESSLSDHDGPYDGVVMAQVSC